MENVSNSFLVLTPSFYSKTIIRIVIMRCLLMFVVTFFSMQCITGTLEYIQKRCSEALENLHTDPETGAKSLRSLLLSTLQHIEDIHNEVCVCVCFIYPENPHLFNPVSYTAKCKHVRPILLYSSVYRTHRCGFIFIDRNFTSS